METRNATTKALKALALAAVFSIALSHVLAAAPSPLISKYFPLNEGDRWVYVKSVQGFNRPTQSPYPMEEVQVTSRQLIEGEEIFAVSNYTFQLGSGTTSFASAVDGPVVELFGAQVGTWYRFEVGQTVNLPEFASDCIHGSQGAVLDRHNYTVPAGSFADCLEIRYTAVPCAEKGLVSETFAPSIGLIERRIKNENGGTDIWALKYARVNGYVFTGPTPEPRIPAEERHALTSPATGVEESSWGRIKSTYTN
jgi:hypothetical protein